ncbi:IS66 family insertion sequence element accessory protein TnpA [Collibacillus ludicampi]|uniref:IS66 family insertion sequence element accessory protein TnpA n=1 Tax=Collibacillus ludicampi TaxID=2771369 RepID=UPI002494A42C|nr:IS66 family insertion sequence element accessory protein TnpB [Collibacillus ludicampi]
MSHAELRKEWEVRIAAFRASGQSASAWCRAHQLKLHQFRYWLRKIEHKEAAVTPSSKWISVKDKNNQEHDRLTRISVDHTHFSMSKHQGSP